MATSEFISVAEARKRHEEDFRAIFGPRTKEEELTLLSDLTGVVEAGLLIRIIQAVCHARNEHPVFGCGAADAMRQVKSEMLEWEAQAMLVERPGVAMDIRRKARSNEEGLNVIATLIRWISTEFDGPLST